MRLHKLGIKTVRDMLFHVPARYDDYSRIKPIANLSLNETATVRGKILSVEGSRTWKRHLHLTQALVQDESGAVKAVWFNQPYLADTLKQGMRVLLSGKTSFANDMLTLSSPVYEILGDASDAEDKETLHTGRLVPVYPETAGVSSRWLRYMIKPLLEIAAKLPEYLPAEILARQDIPPLADALQAVHFPRTTQEAERARKRLAFGELFTLQTAIAKEKLALKQQRAPQISPDIDIAKKFVASLPFTLTDAQRKSAWEILKDMEKPSPMNRLLEGDVGSGKTVVAAMAALQAVRAGWQVAILVPTEILAEQHFKEFAKLLLGRPEFASPTVAILTRSAHKKTSPKIAYAPFKISKDRVAKETADGKIDVVIGTHAIIQETVRFAKLGLIIIDEQHRFGVDQRAALGKQKRALVPHLLSMTATPIPRTLALALYGDLDFSLIKEMPKGRKPIATKIVPPAGRSASYQFIEQQIQEGRQAYVICPLIEESEKLEAKAATKEYERLQKTVFPHRHLALIHGKMKGKEKEKIMQAFKEHETDILVATSVVEVGIDVPNATVMIIEGAERFGLAQLYQFRGRVGRSEHQSHCFLFTDSSGKTVSQRLKALVSAKNSFELAEKDLEIRGPGDFLGGRQSGMPDLVMGSLSDLELVQKTREEARALVEKDPNFIRHPLLAARYEAFRKEVHFE